MDREAWSATAHEVAKSETWLKWLIVHVCNVIEDDVDSMWKKEVGQDEEDWETYSRGARGLYY